MNLKKLLDDAAKSPALVQRLKTEGDKVLDEYKLTEEEKIAIKSGDKNKIARALGDEGIITKSGVYAITVIVVTNA